MQVGRMKNQKVWHELDFQWGAKRGVKKKGGAKGEASSRILKLESGEAGIRPLGLMSGQP